MMLGSFGLGKWFGFRVRIDVSWFIVFALVTWTFAVWELPVKLPGMEARFYLFLGVIGALLLFLSVLLHELAHSVVARSRGIAVHGITLFIFGGVAEMSMEARTPADDFALTVAGPLASLTLAALFGLLIALVFSFICSILFSENILVSSTLVPSNSVLFNPIRCSSPPSI